jgi:hypothetical protein
MRPTWRRSMIGMDYLRIPIEDAGNYKDVLQYLSLRPLGAEVVSPFLRSAAAYMY